MMKFYIILLVLNVSLVFAQVQGLGINNQEPKGVVDLSTEDGSNSTMGLVLPRVDNEQSVVFLQDNDIAHGTVIYDLQENCPKVYLQHLKSWSR